MAKKRRGRARQANVKLPFDKKWLWIGGGVLAALLVGGYALASDEPPATDAEPEPSDVVTHPSYMELPSNDYYTDPSAPATPTPTVSDCRGQRCTSACLFEELWDRSAGDIKSKYKLPYGWGGATGEAYTYQGVDCPAGLDCSGLFVAAARNAGCSLPRRANDQFNAWSQSIAESTAMSTPGAMFAIMKSTGGASHIGMSAGDGSYAIESWGGPTYDKHPSGACGKGSGVRKTSWGWWKRSNKPKVVQFGLLGWSDDAVFGQYAPFDRQAEAEYELLLATPYPPMFIQSGI